MHRSPLLSTWKGWLALVAVSLIPLLYSAFYLGAFWNPYGHLHRLPIAVVNHDQGHASQAVVQSLRQANRVILVSNRTAQSELDRGQVAEMVIIPANYAQQLSRGRILPLTFVLDPGNNYLEALLMQRQVEAIQSSLAAQYQHTALTTLNRAAKRLSGASGQLSGGLTALHAKSQELASAANQLEQQAAAMNSPLASGITHLSQGQMAVSNNMAKIAYSANKIHSGLTSLGDSLAPLPQVTPSHFGHLIMVNPVNQYGAGLAPYFLSLSLWVGALVATVLIPGGNRKTLTLRQHTSLGLSLAQVVALAAGVLLILPLNPRMPWAFWGALILIGVAWWAVIRVLAEKLGDAGRIIAIALLVIQLAGSGGVYPMPLSSAFFQAIHPYLPMTWAVNLVRYALSGGLKPLVWPNVEKLAALFVVSWAITRGIPGHWRFNTPLLEPGDTSDDTAT